MDHTDLITYHSRPQQHHCVFSIVIPTWNNLAYLKTCIGSIQKNSAYQHQLIVHINEGVDGSLEWVKEQTAISYTHSKINIGVCYSLNALATLASTQYILYLNDDMYVCPGWDKALYEEVQAIGHHNFFISATAIEAQPQSNCAIQGDYGKTPGQFDEAGLLKAFDKTQFADWNGATWPPNIVHKTLWDLVGGYSTEFSPGMYSDPDFSMKLWMAGVRYFKGVGKSRVYHFGSATVKRVKKNKGYYKFIQKWGITSSTFGKIYIRRGKPFSGYLPDAAPLTFLQKIKNFWKRLRATVS